MGSFATILRPNSSIVLNTDASLQGLIEKNSLAAVMLICLLKDTF